MQANTNTNNNNNNSGNHDNVHTESSKKRNLLTDFEMYGWTPDPNLSMDDNYMDIVMLLTRNSHCRNGSMGCVLIKDPPPGGVVKDTDDTMTPPNNLLVDSILGAGTNQSFYKEGESDVHAEIAALGQAARYGNSTDGCTAYITMPPCKNCFMALTMAGVQRIVSRYPPPNYVLQRRRMIHLTTLSDESARRSRINKIIQDHKAVVTTQDDLFQRRKQRKEEKQKRKLRAKQKETTLDPKPNDSLENNGERLNCEMKNLQLSSNEC